MSSWAIKITDLLQATEAGVCLMVTRVHETERRDGKADKKIYVMGTLDMRRQYASHEIAFAKAQYYSDMLGLSEEWICQDDTND